MPAVNTTGFGISVIVRPSSHSIPTSTISGPRRLAGRRAQRKHPHATKDQPTSTWSTVSSPSGPCWAVPTSIPRPSAPAVNRSSGANPGDGLRIAHDRSRVDHVMDGADRRRLGDAFPSAARPRASDRDPILRPAASVQTLPRSSEQTPRGPAGWAPLAAASCAPTVSMRHEPTAIQADRCS